MNRLYKITFGTEFDKNQNRIDLDTTKEGYKQLLLDISNHFGGLTETDHIGHYEHDNGELAIEESTSIEIVGKASDRELIVEICEDLKEIFNQESVLLTETEINAVFV